MAMNFKILNTIGDVFDEEGKNILAEVADVDYVNLTQEEFVEILPHYDVILLGIGLRLHKEEIMRASRLKVVASATTGLDHIHISCAEENKINVLSLRGEQEFLNTITGTAELAWGLIIDLLRKVPWSFDSVKRGEWDREKFRGHNLQHKTLGIVGLGRLGKMMAKYGNAFGMRVIFSDPQVQEDLSVGAKKVTLDELLAESDVVSVHVHLTAETENLFNMETFLKMKRNAYLINTSRGLIVNEEDLLGALENSLIAGYGTDVLSHELEFGKKFANYPLVEYSKRNTNVIIVPHIGGMTFDSRSTTDVFMAKKLSEFIKNNF